MISFFSMRCQHEDEDIIPVIGPDPVEHGDEVVSCTACTPLVSNGASADFSSSGVPVNQWYFDKAHSNVRWETPYKTYGSLLTGRFNYFVLENLNFNEAVPSNISFEGYVQLNSVNTGEPGRDTGCLLSTFLTDATKTTETENLATLVSVANSGKYSTSGESFLVDADFTFLGVTKQVTIKLYYFPKSDQDTYNMVGINGEFQILAISDFNVASTNIDDKVSIKLNILLKNKKP